MLYATGCRVSELVGLTLERVDLSNRFVLLLGKGNKALKKPVTTGASNNESIEIVQGVKVGETVILDNLARLRDGMVVEVAKEEAK